MFPGSNGVKASNFKRKGEQKLILLSSSDKLNSSKLTSTRRGISNNVRPHFGNKMQVYGILQHRKSFNTLRSASNICCGRKNYRSELATSPTHSGITTSNTQNKPKSNKLASRLFNRTSYITYYYFSHFKLPWVAGAQSANPSI